MNWTDGGIAGPAIESADRVEMEADLENEIIASVKAGRTVDFEQLVHAYQGALFRIVGNLAGRSMVEDLVQDIFLTAFVKIHTFDPCRGAFRTWLYRIARNHALNARKKKREALFDEAPVISDERTPSGALLMKEAFERLDQALGRLKFQDNVIFVLAELEGVSYADIARIEGLSLGTVKSRLSRIKAKLRNALQQMDNE